LRNKKTILVCLVFLIVVVAAAYALRAGFMLPAKKNVILIVLDTVRADRLGCYGNEENITPEIDRFAQEAVVFNNAFSHAPWTLPSIASIFTSRYPSGHGAGGLLGKFKKLSADNVTLAEVMQRNEIATGAITNVMFLGKKFGMTQGFDLVDEFLPTSNTHMRKATLTTEAALNWLRRNRNEQFFLFVHYFDAHLVYDPPKKFRKQFADPRDRESEEFLFGEISQIVSMRRRGLSLGREKIARLEKLYNAEVAYVDSEVGNLLGSLKQLGLDDNTVVVITSDHGEEFLEHGGFEHGHTLYDELLRVPLIIRDPDNVAAGDGGSKNQGVNNKPPQVSTSVRLIDIAPTLCELAGIGISEAFKGKSLAGLLHGGTEPSRPVLSEGNMWGPGGAAWRQGTWKLIRQDTVPEEQLFNIVSDPGERNNVAQKDLVQARTMTHELSLAVQANTLSRSRGKAAQLNPEEIERLRSLGYMQ